MVRPGLGERRDVSCIFMKARKRDGLSYDIQLPCTRMSRSETSEMAFEVAEAFEAAHGVIFDRFHTMQGEVIPKARKLRWSTTL